MQKDTKTAIKQPTLRSLLGIDQQDAYYADFCSKSTVKIVQNFLGDCSSFFIADFGQVFAGWVCCAKEFVFNQKDVILTLT